MAHAEQFRQPHAVLDLASRRWKARKIELLLNLPKQDRPIRMLEIGTGSGGIAHYFGTHPHQRYLVDAVDVHDSRLITDGFRYTHVGGTKLPFLNDTFDVVLTNHVIEHVGDAEDQFSHLCEVRRVLKPGGLGYLAVPNRWMLIEPHYKLAFLSWLPHVWRTPYLRATGKGAIYDCEPLQMRELEHLFIRANLEYRNMCIAALRATFDIERSKSLAAQLLKWVPDTVVALFLPVIPTLIYRFSRPI